MRLRIRLGVVKIKILFWRIMTLKEKILISIWDEDPGEEWNKPWNSTLISLSILLLLAILIGTLEFVSYQSQDDWYHPAESHYITFDYGLEVEVIKFSEE